MPPQASAAGHRVTTRVRRVATITTMHPASVTTTPRPVTFRLCFSRTAALPSRGGKPAIQISRPPGHAAPYATRAGAPGSFRLHTRARRAASGEGPLTLTDQRVSGLCGPDGARRISLSTAGTAQLSAGATTTDRRWEQVPPTAVLGMRMRCSRSRVRRFSSVVCQVTPGC